MEYKIILIFKPIDGWHKIFGNKFIDRQRKTWKYKKKKKYLNQNLAIILKEIQVMITQ